MLPIHQPLISVLIPTYNVEAFVEDAINSILSQTYSNLEIIIVDDCSTDNTYEILSKLAQLDTRIKLFKNPENQKIVKTLNFALKQAKGEFIARMDGDDLSLPTRIERQLNYLSIHPEVDLVGVNVTMIDENGLFIQEGKYLQYHNDIVIASKYVSPVLHIWLAKREVYERLEKYRIYSVEDYDFILRAIDSGFKLANLQEPLYLQRIRTGNTATSSGLIQYRMRKYALKLAKERKKGTIDSYSDATIKKIENVSTLNGSLFKISSSFHHKYIVLKKKNFFLAALNRGLSIVFSPLRQCSQIVSRYRYNKIKKGVLRSEE